MAQRVHLVSGGELVDPVRNVLNDTDGLQSDGKFPNYEKACNARKAEMQRAVDNTRLRYFILYPHTFRDEVSGASPTEKLG